MSFVSFVVKKSLTYWLSAATDVHHRGTERTENSQRRLSFFYLLDNVHDKRGAKKEEGLILLSLFFLPS